MASDAELVASLYPALSQDYRSLLKFGSGQTYPNCPNCSGGHTHTPMEIRILELQPDLVRAALGDVGKLSAPPRLFWLAFSSWFIEQHMAFSKVTSWQIQSWKVIPGNSLVETEIGIFTARELQANLMIEGKAAIARFWLGSQGLIKFSVAHEEQNAAGHFRYESLAQRSSLHPPVNIIHPAPLPTKPPSPIDIPPRH
ncbi:MAG: hypothetical protein ACAI44_27075 [Candidatus Sericytochromatia bacterium]